MLARLGYVDEATSLALLHDLDLDVVFSLLVDKYLGALAAEQEYVEPFQPASLVAMERKQLTFIPTMYT